MNKITGKEEIFANSIGIIIRKGYNNTGLTEIIKASDIPKGSFYNYFKSKEDYGLQLLDFIADKIFSHIESYKNHTELSPLKQLHLFFDDFLKYYQENDFKGGCPIGNFAQELGDINENFRKKTEEKFQQVITTFASFLTDAKKQNEIADDINEFKLANTITNYWQGTLLRLKVSKEPQHYKDFLKLIFEVLLKKI